MKITPITPQNALDKHFVKLRPLRSEVELFKRNLLKLLDNVDEIEHEENQKNHIRDFIVDSFYKNNYEVNTKEAIDMVIHNGKSSKDTVGVIIEVKRPSNKTEMFSEDNPNCKAFQELILYYLKERIGSDKPNTDIKYLIITNVYKWYIFQATDFENFFFKSNFKNEYLKWQNNQKILDNTSFFYNDIARPYLNRLENEFRYISFDIRDYEKILRNNNLEDDKQLIPLYKIISPYFLLKQPFINDSNSLNDKFYKELLHIIGLEEVKEKGMSIIRRKEKDRQNGSIIENVINKLETDDVLYRMKELQTYGKNKEEQLFGIGLSLCLTWINRILFLKLLEGQLIIYHKNNLDYRFLNTKTISDFDELYKLFHQVLAKNIDERAPAISQKYSKIPYLNSSLFDISELEFHSVKINQLDNSLSIDIIKNSVLNERKTHTGILNTLDYLFEFLDAYDFASEGGDEIAEDNKTIINASVLGKVFEKINGYKDGSIFTPGVITMYMSREVMRKAVLQKYNDYFKANELPEATSFDDLYNKLDKISIDKANEIINSLKICDPSVGSGHFLVSVLNELIVIKYELGILADNQGKRLNKRDYEIIVENDELIIFDEDRNLFKYSITNKESQRVQETIFRERHDIIENCLFGVDINENSVKICRLRLWIELLKSSYYKAPDFTELETLPNIDINIKHGNSLLSRYPLDADLKKALQQNKIDIQSYRKAISDYRNATSKEQKREMEQIIFAVKNNFETEIQKTDKRFLKLSATKGELYALTNQVQMFETSKKEQEDREKKIAKLSKDLKTQENEIKQIQDNSVYKNAFEWRFEFPEVLNNDGDFVGFDVIIGNPPYVQLQANGGELANQLANQNYETFARTGDIYCLFYEKGHQLLKSDGFLNFITSNKWMRAGYGEATRKFLAEKTNPISLIDFSGQKVFENATVDVNILLFSKQKNEGKTTACIVKEKTADKLSDYIRQNSAKIDFSNSGSDSWVVLSSIEQRIKAKIEKAGTPLKDWDINIYRGILTGYNEAFIIDGKKKDELIERDPKSAEIIRPILRGRDIKRYGYDFADLYLIATFPSLKIDIEEYPTIKEHLLSFGYDRLKQTGENGARKKTNNKWYETQDSISYWEDFSKQKIVWGNLNLTASFTIAQEGMFINAPSSLIVPTNKYILSVLNSKLGDYYIRNLGVTRNGGYFEYKPMFIEQLPIPEITDLEQKIFIDLIDELIISNNSERIKIEDKIEKLIFDLYDLTTEERETIGFIEIK